MTTVAGRSTSWPAIDVAASCEAGTYQRCRILYIAGELHKGGYERQLYYLVGALARDRYAPAVAVWNYRPSDLHARLIEGLGVPVYPLSGGRGRVAKLTRLRRLVKALRPEVVHSYNFYTNVAASWAAWATPAVVCGSVRNGFVWSRETTGPVLGRASSAWPSHQIFNSLAAAAEVSACRSYFVPKHVHVVVNGLDLERFVPRAIPSTEPPIVVGLGYWLPAKRWDRVIDAAAILKSRGLLFRVRLVGGGPLERDLRQQIRKVNVADRVELVAHTDDVPRLFADAAFVVHTADDEGCPNAVMEAMACGRAVVATGAGDIPRLIDDGTTGYVVAPHDRATLAERLAALMTDRAACARMGAAARQHAEREFGIDRLVRRTLEAYRAAGWVAGSSDEGASAPGGRFGGEPPTFSAGGVGRAGP